MNETFLNQLREIFRADFKEHDYCIGQECVENLFRKLLNEQPMEPIKGDPIPYANLSEAFRTELEKFTKKLPGIMEREDGFYQKLK